MTRNKFYFRDGRYRQVSLYIGLDGNCYTSMAWWRHQMETFRVTGPFLGEFTGHRWIPRTKTSEAVE